MAVTVVVDAGHGGYDNGAVNNSRREKDDNLAIALAVGEKLAQRGINVVYTRTEDVYDSPVRKAQIANQSGADFFVSIHRNSSPSPNQYSGVETLLYDENGVKLDVANAINEELSNVGFRNLGINIRKDLAVLRRTNMPAALVEVGFINTDADNELLDARFDATAEAIADGIANTLLDTMEVISEESSGSGERTGTARYDISQNGTGWNDSEMNGTQSNEWSGMGTDMNGTGTGMNGTGTSMMGTGNEMQNNGTWENGMQSNGAWGNGMQNNGAWGNGMQNNGALENGMQNNGAWGNGMQNQGMQNNDTEVPQYAVQVGLFRNPENADNLFRELVALGIPSAIQRNGRFFAVSAGKTEDLNSAVELQKELQQLGYDTLVITL